MGLGEGEKSWERTRQTSRAGQIWTVGQPLDLKSYGGNHLVHKMRLAKNGFGRREKSLERTRQTSRAGQTGTVRQSLDLKSYGGNYLVHKMCLAKNGFGLRGETIGAHAPIFSCGTNGNSGTALGRQKLRRKPFGS